MWGRYVEHEMHEAVKKAKTESQAQTKAMMVMRRIMTEPTEEVSEEEVQAVPAPTGQFRDPAAKYAKE